MALTDMMFEGKVRSRLDLVRRVSHEFIPGEGHELAGRPGDVIGIMTFAAGQRLQPAAFGFHCRPGGSMVERLSGADARGDDASLSSGAGGNIAKRRGGLGALARCYRSDRGCLGSAFFGRLHQDGSIDCTYFNDALMHASREHHCKGRHQDRDGVGLCGTHRV